ncbi:MAG: hypothetical protein JRH11_11475 [Deltaproteobacteria bacterium]|nr:hypothetical protein [Deltaproteobacteria bacterium]
MHAMGCGASTGTSNPDDQGVRSGGQHWADSGARQLPTTTLDESSARRATEGGWHANSLFPHQTWPDVVGRRRGIVMSAGAQAWGGSILWGRSFDLSETRTEYRFYAEGSSAYAVYWASPDGRGNNPMGWNVLDERGAEQPYPSAMFQYDTPNEWGLHRRAHLVEVEALQLATSSNSGLHFVIRSARVLDATPGYPLVVEDALMQLRARFDRELVASARDIERILGEGREPVPADHERQATDAATIAVFPTWLDAERVMDVVFIARYREVHLGPSQTRMSQCPPCLCDSRGCAPCVRCMPREETFRPQVTAGYEMAARYRVSHDGRVVGEEIFEAKSY